MPHSDIFARLAVRRLLFAFISEFLFESTHTASSTSSSSSLLGGIRGGGRACSSGR